jgi:hypothetical protein
VSAADYAIGLHASSLVADGGTLQIGIGSLGDAIGQALIVRDRHGAEYRRILESLCPDGLAGPRTGRFEQGLYGCSEMFVNGFLKLIEAGIIRREVFGDADAAASSSTRAASHRHRDARTRCARCCEARPHRQRRCGEDVASCSASACCARGARCKTASWCGATAVGNDLDDSRPSTRAVLQAHMLGKRLAAASS